LTEAEAAALSLRTRPHKRLLIAADSISAVNDASLPCRLLDMELPFARVLLFLGHESATLLATGVCRDVRSRAAAMYSRYCRVAVRRLETDAAKSNHSSSAELVPTGASGAAAYADGIAPTVWSEARALADEAACHAFCLGSMSMDDDDAPWRMRTAISTLKMVSSVGAFAVQTLAAQPNKLNVLKRSFEVLSPPDQSLLLDTGVVHKTVSVVSGSTAPVRFSHHTKPAARAIRPDVDVATQLAACQQDEKEAYASLELLKQSIRSAWPAGAKIDVAGEGTVTLGKTAGESTRVLYSCPGGEAAFKRDLSDEQQQRLEHVFVRPEPLLHVRGHAVGREHGKPKMTVNSSGRALTASFTTSADDNAARLPTHAFGARRRR
jgi:hypothetical protein